MYDFLRSQDGGVPAEPMVVRSRYVTLPPGWDAQPDPDSWYTPEDRLIDTLFAENVDDVSTPPVSIFPPWLYHSTTFCFNWSVQDDDAGQCNASAGGQTCADVGAYTDAYDDRTNHHSGGGCTLQWGVFALPGVPQWFYDIELCFRYAASAQLRKAKCDGGVTETAERCSAVDSYLPGYVDYTHATGNTYGCQLAWKLKLPSNAEVWAEELKLCMSWVRSGPGNTYPCNGTSLPHSDTCAYANEWLDYHDGTNHKDNGCVLQWGIFV